MFASLAFRGDAISWAALLVTIAATHGVVVLITWRLKLL